MLFLSINEAFQKLHKKRIFLFQRVKLLDGFIGQPFGKGMLPDGAEFAGDAGLLKFQQAAVYLLKTSSKSFG